MDEDINDKLYHISEEFWVEFSKLVNTALEKAPESHRPDLAMMLQDRCSVYSVMK